MVNVDTKSTINHFDTAAVVLLRNKETRNKEEVAFVSISWDWK